MALNYKNLDADTRAQMLAEIEYDVERGAVYFSPRLSVSGREDYIKILVDSAKAHDDAYLASELGRAGRLNATETRKHASGKLIEAKVPHTANETLAEGEFNRFYIRGLCRRAIDSGQTELVVYRAKEAANPRRESEEKIGTRVSAEKLLADLRANVGLDTALGLPAGPNSGLSLTLR